MKYYIEYLASNENTYRRSLTYSIMFSLLAIFIVAAITINAKEQYIIEGEVQSIGRSQVPRKNNTTFDLKQRYHLEDVINIKINGISYYVGPNFKKRWDEVLNKVQVGDNIMIRYLITEEQNRVCQLEKDTSIILNYREIEGFFFLFKIGILILATLLLTYSFLLISKRRKILKNGRVSH